jgi:hypothetical protein
MVGFSRVSLAFLSQHQIHEAAKFMEGYMGRVSRLGQSDSVRQHQDVFFPRLDREIQFYFKRRSLSLSDKANIHESVTSIMRWLLTFRYLSSPSLNSSSPSLNSSSLLSQENETKKEIETINEPKNQTERRFDDDDDDSWFLELQSWLHQCDWKDRIDDWKKAEATLNISCNRMKVADFSQIQLGKKRTGQREILDVTPTREAQLSCPDALFSLLADDYGEKEAQRLCLASNERPPTVIRVNTTKTTREDLLAVFQNRLKIPATPTRQSPDGIELHLRSGTPKTGRYQLRGLDIFALPEFQEGHFELQDEASQLDLTEICHLHPIA